MRFLKKFESTNTDNTDNTDNNEVVDEVVDEVVYDVGEFFKLFIDRIKSKSYYNLDEIEEQLDDLMYSKFDSFDYYQLYEYDTDGRYSYAKSKIIKAVSELHAKVKYSIMLNRIDVFSSGYYFVKKVNREVVDKKIDELEKSIKLSSEYLDYLKQL